VSWIFPYISFLDGWAAQKFLKHWETDAEYMRDTDKLRELMQDNQLID
jgi:hypothetical protein